MSNGSDNGQKATRIPGDLTGFTGFVEKHYGVIYSVALAHTREPEVAQEITQDVCLRLLLDRDKLPPLVNPAGWLARVARNTAVDWIRRRQTHSRVVAMLESRLTDMEQAKSASPDARSAAMREEERGRIQEALAQIDPLDSELLLMHFMDGMEKQEIARLLEIHPSTVGRRMDKALRRLRRTLTDFDPKRMGGLRPSRHSAGKVIALLGAAAALGTADKAALAGVAAATPLTWPLGTSGVAGAGVSGGTGGGVPGWLTRGGVGQWAGPVVVGLALTAGVYAISQRREAPPVADRPTVIAARSPASVSPGHSPTGKKLATARRRAVVEPSQMRGLESDSVQVSYTPRTEAVISGVFGTVTDQSGEPIAGAEVWLTDYDNYKETVRTDAEGRYRLRGDVNAYADVRVNAEGYAHATYGEYNIQVPLPAPIPVNITLEPPNTLRGAVVNEQGERVPDARVMVMREFDRDKEIYQGTMGQLIFETKSNAQGEFEFEGLKAGSVAMVVNHPDYADYLAEPVATDEQAAKLTIGKGFTLEGVVTDKGTSVANATVKVSGGKMSHCQLGKGLATTDENGYFVVENLTVPARMLSWPYSVDVSAPGTSIPLYLIDISKSETTQTLNMAAEDSRAKEEEWTSQTVVNLRGDAAKRFEPAVDEKKKGSAVIHVSLPAEKDNGTTPSVSVTVYQDGEYLKYEQPEAMEFDLVDLPAGDIKLNISGNGIKYLPETVRTEDNGRYRVQMRTGSETINGTLTNRVDGKKYTAILYTADRESPWYIHSPAVLGRADVDASGKFQFANVVPGEYGVNVWAESSIMSAPVECVAGGANNVEITLPDLQPVSGTVLALPDNKPEANANIWITNSTRNPTGSTGVYETAADKNGAYQLQLPPGSYIAQIKDKHQRSVAFKVTSGSATVVPPLYEGDFKGTLVIDTSAYDSPVKLKELDVYIIDEADPISSHYSFGTGSTVGRKVKVLQNLKTGRSSIVLKQSFGASENADLPATVFVQNVEISDKQVATIEYRPETGKPVVLRAHMGKYLGEIGFPNFWLRDVASGVKLPLLLASNYENKHTLAPGKYEFGAMLNDGTEQVQAFEIMASDDDEKARVIELMLD